MTTTHAQIWQAISEDLDRLANVSTDILLAQKNVDSYLNSYVQMAILVKFDINRCHTYVNADALEIYAYFNNDTAVYRKVIKIPLPDKTADAVENYRNVSENTDDAYDRAMKAL